MLGGKLPNDEVMVQLFNPLKAAVVDSMRALCPYTVGTKLRTDTADQKEDNTLVTQLDLVSGAAAITSLLELPADMVEFAMEDIEARKNPDAPFLLLYDPWDGTRAGANGLFTSTVIGAILEKATGEVIMTIIGAPATGQIWWAMGNGAAWLEVLDSGNPADEVPANVLRDTKVWNGHIDDKATVYLDVNHGFERKTLTGERRQVLNNRTMANLFANLTNCCLFVHMPGSNGLMHALVANGGERLAGGITTAIGGPWDIAGVLLILQAGGAAVGIRINGREYEKISPLRIIEADILVFGNNEETVTVLTEIVIQSITD